MLVTLASHSSKTSVQTCDESASGLQIRPPKLHLTLHMKARSRKFNCFKMTTGRKSLIFKICGSTRRSLLGGRFGSLISSDREGERGVRGAVGRGGGSVFFLLENPRRGGGISEEGGGPRGQEGVCGELGVGGV